MDQLIKDIVVGICMPSGLLYMIIKFVVIPITEKYIAYVDKSMATMDMISTTQAKCVEIQTRVLEELKLLKERK